MQGSFFCLHAVHMSSVYSHGDLDTSPRHLKQYFFYIFKQEPCCVVGEDDVCILLGYSTQSPSANTSLKFFS